MADIIFSARFTPSDSVALVDNKFTVKADIFDGTGMFSGFDVQPDDIVFLDCFASISNPTSVCRYTVESVSSRTGSKVTVVLHFVDTGVVVDPSEVVGNYGFICRPSGINSSVFHAAPTLHSFPDYVVQYSRNLENLTTNNNIPAHLVVKAKGVTLSTDASEINFVGDGITATSVSSGKVEVLVSGGEPISSTVSLEGYQSIKSSLIAANTAVRLELTINAFQTDGGHAASFKRTGMFYRNESGSVQIVGQTWISDQTMKTHPAMSVDFDMENDLVNFKVQNSGSLPTKWVGVLASTTISL